MATLKVLTGVYAITKESVGGREPTPTEVRRMRHWIRLGKVRTRKIGALHVTTPQQLSEDLCVPEAAA